MSVDHEALVDYIEAGYELIPLHRFDQVDSRGRGRGKSPLNAGWRHKVYRPEHVLEHAKRGNNVGVRLTRGHLVVDVDPRNFGGGSPMEELATRGLLDVSLCPHVVTGSGGHHYYWTKPEDVSVVDSLKDFPGVEFKSFGRQVVAAGSIHPCGNLYVWDAFAPPLSMAPEFPEKLLRIIQRPDPKSSAESGQLSPEELKVCLDQIPAETFRGDHDRWFKLMAACHHATAGEARQEFLNWSTSDPHYAEDAWVIGGRWDSLHKERHGAVTIGTLFREVLDNGGEIPRVSAEQDFDPVDPGIAGLPPTPSFLETMNARHCVVNEGGRFRIYTEMRDPVLSRTYYGRSTETDFRQLYANKRIETPDGSTQPVAKAWLGHPGRRQYEGVIFDPMKDHTGYLNLWQGWAFEPVKGDWSELHRLVFEILCGSDPACFEYIMNWSAYMVQHPDQPAEVALCFRGEKGTGKGTFGRALAALAGRHGIQINSPTHLTGRFNWHMKDCILLFADEAFWAGDKAGEAVLKGLITEPLTFIEKKGDDGHMSPNMVHLVMASNSEWMVPAGLDRERRFAVFDVLDSAAGDMARFERINRQLYEEGGIQGLLYDLMARDLGKWHPRASVPMTNALIDQKIRTLDPLQHWWYERLSRGSLPSSDGIWEMEWVWVYSDDLMACIQREVDGMGFKRIHGLSTTIGRRLKTMIPRIRKERKRAGGGRSDLDVDSQGRATGYMIPPLEDCRESFELRLGGKLEW